MVADERAVLVIAEAGVNHNGSLEQAKQLIDVAAEAGADVVKFQTFTADRIASHRARQAEYQEKNLDSSDNKSQLEMLRELELSESDHLELRSHCRNKGIEFLSTAFDLQSLEFLKALGITRFKVPSGEATNLPYLRRVAELSQEVILSTGMCSMGDIEAAIDALESAGVRRKDVTVLHCTTEYPAPVGEINLLAMQNIGEAFGVKVGYSDHSMGIEVPLAAVALGAKVIEKHFTLDATAHGPDHAASLEPHELGRMVAGIRKIEEALGSPLKRRTASEVSNVVAVRKSIVASRCIRRGEEFSTDNLTTKRPGDGVSPMRWDEVIGRVADREYAKDELIRL